MTSRLPVIPLHRALVRLGALLLMMCVFTGVAPAQTGTAVEVWPELNAFIRLDPQFRLYLVAAYAKGKESDLRTLDLSANVDISLRPIVRDRYQQTDWHRSRILWVRFGYDHVVRTEAGERKAPEERGMANVFMKAALPEEIWAEGRARVDFRWIGGVYSTRYRLRAEAVREFAVQGHPIVPYLNAEIFYDTRYSGWSRLLIMTGGEFTVNDLWRLEVYAAPQFDFLPASSSLLAFGVVGKFYF